jgi:hypothetical protein
VPAASSALTFVDLTDHDISSLAGLLAEQGEEAGEDIRVSPPQGPTIGPGRGLKATPGPLTGQDRTAGSLYQVMKQGRDHNKCRKEYKCGLGPNIPVQYFKQDLMYHVDGEADLAQPDQGRRRKKPSDRAMPAGEDDNQHREYPA